jgi:hypothetical protein
MDIVKFRLLVWNYKALDIVMLKGQDATKPLSIHAHDCKIEPRLPLIMLMDNLTRKFASSSDPWTVEE